MESKDSLCSVALPDGTRITLDEEKLNTLYRQLGWHTIKPVAALRRLRGPTCSGLFEAPISISIDPEKIRKSYEKLFGARNESITILAKYSMLEALAHELGHFFNFNYARGARRHWARQYKWYSKVGCGFVWGFLIWAMLSLAYCLYAAWNIFTNNWSVSLVSSDLLQLIFVGLLWPLLAKVLFKAKSREERNADCFAARLTDAHGKLLEQCIVIMQEKPHTETPSAMLLPGSRSPEVT